MKLRPAPNLNWLGLALVAASVGTFVWPPLAWALPIGLAAAVVLGIYDWMQLRRMLHGISVARQMPVVAGRDMPFSVTIVVANSGSLSVSGAVRDVVPSLARPFDLRRPILLAPGAQAALETETRIDIRGRYEFGPAWVRLRGPMQMLEGQQAFDCPGVVKVLPEGYHSAHNLSQQSADDVRFLDKLKRARLRGVGSEFESLDEYREGDDPRRIDWRTTARVGRLIVRHFQIERHRDVMIVVDCGRLMGADATQGTKLDCAVDASLMLARVALGGGDRCGVAVFDDRVRAYLPPRAGFGVMKGITEGLYDVKSDFRESDFGLMFATLQSRQQKRGLIVVISDFVDADTTERYRGALALLARRHLVLFAALQTPYLVDLPLQRVRTQLDGARAAVAFGTLRERERALLSLRMAGISVVDVIPKDLTPPLINRFIELRTANSL